MLYFFLFLFSLLVTNHARAFEFFDRIQVIGQKAYGQSVPATPTEIVEGFVMILLGLVGTIFIVLIIYSGFKWMTSGGNEKEITAAKDTLRSSTIGLIIIVLAYAIAATVVNWLQAAI